MFGRMGIASLMIVLTMAANAPASFVNAINPAAGTGASQNAELTSYDFTDHIGNDPGPNTNEGYVGPGALNNNFADLNFNVNQQSSPFNVQVVRAGGNAQAAEYWFEVTLHNTTASTINHLGIGLFNAANSGIPAQFARFDLPDGFNSDGGTFTRISDSMAQFTGLNLAVGASKTLGFGLDLLADLEGPRFDQNAPLFIQFTSAPEPHAVLLGGLCLLGFVGVMLQRRRHAKLAPVNGEGDRF
jgi:hypothetical protein